MSKTKSQLQEDIAKFDALISKSTTSEEQKKVFRAIKSKAEAKLSSMDKEAPKKEEPKKEAPKPKAVAKKQQSQRKHLLRKKPQLKRRLLKRSRQLKRLQLKRLQLVKVVTQVRSLN